MASSARHLGRRAVLSCAMACVVLLGACGGSDEATPARIDISFDSPTTDWVLGSSDYTTDTAPGFVSLDVIELPAPFKGRALTASGQNYSDDLWLYVKKRFDGLSAGQTYDARVTLTILAGVPQGCVGVGGAPGESVFVKAGVSGIEPTTVKVGDEFLMNIDKGNQAVGGAVGQLLGDITSSGTDCRVVPAEAKTMQGPAPIRVRADASGAVWVFFGIDSGYESGAGVTLMSATVVLDPA